MEGPAGLRPRTVGEILDGAFVLYRKRFGRLLLAATILSLPTLAVSVALSHAAGAAFHEYIGAGFEYVRGSSGARGPDWKALERWLESSWTVQVYSIVSAAMQAVSRGGGCVAGAFVVAAAFRGEPTPSAWALVRRSLPHVVAATLVHFVLVVGSVVSGMCCFLLPVLVVFTAMVAPACAVLALEAPGAAASARARTLPPVIGPVLRAFTVPIAAATASIARAMRLSSHGMTLVRGSFCVSVVLALVSIVVTFVSLAGGLVTKSFGVAFVLQHYAEVVFLPVIGVTFALWYFDLRVRREGADLEAAP